MSSSERWCCAPAASTVPGRPAIPAPLRPLSGSCSISGKAWAASSVRNMTFHRSASPAAGRLSSTQASNRAEAHGGAGRESFPGSGTTGSSLPPQRLSADWAADTRQPRPASPARPLPLRSSGSLALDCPRVARQTSDINLPPAQRVSGRRVNPAATIYGPVGRERSICSSQPRPAISPVGLWLVAVGLPHICGESFAGLPNPGLRSNQNRQAKPHVYCLCVVDSTSRLPQVQQGATAANEIRASEVRL
jgi:hypothetical protein